MQQHVIQVPVYIFQRITQSKEEKKIINHENQEYTHSRISILRNAWERKGERRGDDRVKEEMEGDNVGKKERYIGEERKFRGVVSEDKSQGRSGEDTKAEEERQVIVTRKEGEK